MINYQSNEIELNQATRRDLCKEYLMPAADIMADGNFRHSNLRSVQEQQMLPTGEDVPEKILLSFHAASLGTERRDAPAQFTIVKAVLVDIDSIKNPEASIATSFDDDDYDMHVLQDKIAYIEEFFESDDIDDIQGHEAVIEKTTLTLNSDTLEVSRYFDMQRFVRGVYVGSFQQSPAPLILGEPNDEDQNERMKSEMEALSTYWSSEDFKTVHFTLRALGLYLPR